MSNTLALGRDRYMISVPSSVREVTNNRFRGERVRIEELENLLLLQTPHKADPIGLWWSGGIGVRASNLTPDRKRESNTRSDGGKFLCGN